jgi:hypothetical protein
MLASIQDEITLAAEYKSSTFRVMRLSLFPSWFIFPSSTKDSPSGEAIPAQLVKKPRFVEPEDSLPCSTKLTARSILSQFNAINTPYSFQDRLNLLLPLSLQPFVDFGFLRQVSLI